jgi:hypothetical protein
MLTRAADADGCLAHACEFFNSINRQAYPKNPTKAKNKFVNGRKLRVTAGHPQISRMTRITSGSAGILPAGLWFRYRIRRQDAGAPSSNFVDSRPRKSETFVVAVSISR